MFLREHPRRAAVALVMRINLRATGDSLFQIAKHQQTFSRGLVIGKPAVLGKNGSAAREISGATVAQPTGLQLSIDWLWARNLGARAANVIRDTAGEAATWWGSQWLPKKIDDHASILDKIRRFTMIGTDCAVRSCTSATTGAGARYFRQLCGMWGFASRQPHS